MRRRSTKKKQPTGAHIAAVSSAITHRDVAISEPPPLAEVPHGHAAREPHAVQYSSLPRRILTVWLIVVAIYVVCNQFTTVPLGVERTELHPPANGFDAVCDLLYHIVWLPFTLAFAIKHIATLGLRASDQFARWVGGQLMKLGVWTAVWIVSQLNAFGTWAHGWIVLIGYHVADAFVACVDALHAALERVQSEATRVWLWFNHIVIPTLVSWIRTATIWFYESVPLPLWTMFLTACSWAGEWIVAFAMWAWSVVDAIVAAGETCIMAFYHWILVPFCTALARCTAAVSVLCSWFFASVLMPSYRWLCIGAEISKETAIWFLEEIVWFYVCLAACTAWHPVVVAWNYVAYDVGPRVWHATIVVPCAAFARACSAQWQFLVADVWPRTMAAAIGSWIRFVDLQERMQLAFWAAQERLWRGN